MSHSIDTVLYSIVVVAAYVASAGAASLASSASVAAVAAAVVLSTSTIIEQSLQSTVYLAFVFLVLKELQQLQLQQVLGIIIS